MNGLLSSIAVAAIALTPLGAQALDRDQPIRVVTAFPPGGVTDIAGRIIADALVEELGQAVIVDNRPGGDGVIGLMEGANAAPDGNNLFLGGFGGQLLPPLLKSNFPIDVREQLTFIARPAGFSNVLVVNNDLPFETVEEFIAYAKEHPGELNFGSAATASSDRMTTLMFMQMTGTELTWVPYKGGAAALNAVSNGTIDVLFANMPTAMGLIEGGGVKPLAVTAIDRVAQFPDLPTLDEEGVEGFDVTSWISLFGPAGMAEEDVKLLSDAVVKVVAIPEVAEQLNRVGFVVLGEGAEEFRASYDAEWDRWKAVIDEAGIRE